jgi:hypothetical protein
MLRMNLEVVFDTCLPPCVRLRYHTTPHQTGGREKTKRPFIQRQKQAEFIA